MTTASARPSGAGASLHSADRVGLASAAPSVPGLPWYGAVAVLLVLTVIGVVIGGATFAAGVPIILWVTFLLGVVLAVAAVRRRAVFTAMVQPPLIAAVVIFLAAQFSGADLVFSAVPVVKAFPMMAVGTVLAVLLGLLRIALAPMRDRRPATNAPASSTDA